MALVKKEDVLNVLKQHGQLSTTSIRDVLINPRYGYGYKSNLKSSYVLYVMKELQHVEEAVEIAPTDSRKHLSWRIK